jgi:hypothetical protein
MITEMGLEKIEYINRIEILDSGELFLGIEGEGKAMYQYIYREAAGVCWEPTLKGFKSTELKDWSPSQWFFHIVAIARMGIGVSLVLRESIQWKGLSDQEMAAIIQGNCSQDA